MCKGSIVWSSIIFARAGLLLVGSVLSQSRQVPLETRSSDSHRIQASIIKPLQVTVDPDFIPNMLVWEGTRDEIARAWGSKIADEVHKARVKREPLAPFDVALLATIQFPFGQPRVERLLAAGANPNAKNRLKQTPLHFAAKSGEVTVINLLLAKGADINAQDAAGDTPLHYAVAFENSGTADALRTRGAREIANLAGKRPDDLAQDKKAAQALRIQKKSPFESSKPLTH